jgi:hypothetical protein
MRLDHEILIDSDRYRPAIAWCEQQFGPRQSLLQTRSGRWTVFWAGTDMPNKYKFFFADEQEAGFFALKWR